jgi:hypothetical protein
LLLRPGKLAYFIYLGVKVVTEAILIMLENLNKIVFRITHWETWNWFVKYIPMLPHWIWYCIRSRSLWFFTASNPTLTFGGFEGENKKEMYEALPLGTYPTSVFVNPGKPFSEVKNIFVSNNFQFPCAVKPDVGQMGIMFRKIDSFGELQRYHEIMKADYIIQEFIDYPLEVSVFYYRFPNQKKGTITGFVKKEYLSVTGDGSSTLWQLIKNYPRVAFRQDEMREKHSVNLNTVIPKGELYILSHALNLSRGGKLVSLEHEKDEKLLAVFDKLSHHTGFLFGRYDIKCKSIEDLKNEKNFSILEFNGSGAEPHHVYGNGNNVFKAISILLDHWNVLYNISKANNMLGIQYWNFIRGIEHLNKAKRHFTLLRALESKLADPEPVSNPEQSIAISPYLSDLSSSANAK